MASARRPERNEKARARARAGGEREIAPSSDLLLSPADLRWNCPPIEPSGRAPTAAFLLDQDRPMQALRTGLSIHAQGYNLFVSGLVGSGRTTVVEHLLRDIQPFCARTLDRLFVHNFREPARPVLISVPPGKAAAFREELADLGRALRDSLRAALRSRPHRMSRRVVMRGSEDRERRIMDALQRQAQRLGCAVVRFQSQTGGASADIYPVVDGEPITLDALSALAIEGKVSPEKRDELAQNREHLLERLREAGERVRDELRRVQRELREMDRALAYRVLSTQTRDFLLRWDQPKVQDWIDMVREHFERSASTWAETEVDEQEPGGASEGAGAGGSDPGDALFGFSAQIVKSSLSSACPVVVETNPTFANLFGTIAPLRDGEVPGPHQIHPGALLRADGGYLILRASDVLLEQGVWPRLKRTLQTGRLEIREFDQGAGAPAGSLLPEAIPIELKVVMIGEPGVYETLAAEDPQFPQIFKIHAEFDTSIPVNRVNLSRYADYLAWLVEAEKLKPFHPDGAAAVAEYGARAAGRRDRLIIRYSELGDLAREASHLCTVEGDREIRRAHVEMAIRSQRYRHDLQQELVERDYASGYMRLSTTGRAVGQINALTVLDTGTLEFGRPCRITCNSGIAVAERSGLVNIEGAVDLSGPIHDKGVLILEGYMLQEFGGEGPLCMQARICFEQLYNGVEGDSASLAQLLALLSSLAEMPLDQGLAITGSVNQKGEVQAVSAVNEKIEGFYRLCRARRLTGTQGVVLPRANVSDLMLDRAVVEAVARGEFRVHAVSRVEEAAALFTGRPARELMDGVRRRLESYRAAVLGRRRP
ncbi:MAG: ATP-binding protein [Planctomycetota bacterium]